MPEEICSYIMVAAGCKEYRYKLGHSRWNGFKVEIKGTFTNTNRELKLPQQLAVLK